MTGLQPGGEGDPGILLMAPIEAPSQHARGQRRRTVAGVVAGFGLVVGAGLLTGCGDGGTETTRSGGTPTSAEGVDSGDSVLGTQDTAEGTTSSTTTTTAAPAPDVRTVDLQNATLPAGSCGHEAWANPHAIPLDSGRGSSGDSNLVHPDGRFDYAVVERVGAPLYGDVDGDGDTDAVVELGCSAGGARGETLVAVLDWNGSVLSLIGGQNIRPTQVGETPGGYIEADTVSLDGSTVAANQSFPAHTDDTVMTGRATAEWQFSDGSWSVSSEITNPGQAPPPPPPPPEPAPTGDNPFCDMPGFEEMTTDPDTGLPLPPCP